MKLGSDCRSACSSLTTTSRRVWRSIAFQTSPMLPCPSCFCNSYRLIRFGLFGLSKLVLIVLTHTAFFANGGTLSGGAEGAGRRPASLPGLQGVPENLFSPFFRAAAEGAGRRLASLPGLRGVPENLFSP